MNIFSQIRNLRKDNHGSTIVEFAFIAPALIVFSVLILEFTLAFMNYIKLDEAARQATRTAFMESPVASIANLSGSAAVCTKPANTLSCGSYSVNSSTAFNNIVASAQNVVSNLNSANVTVTYTPSGIGLSSTADGTAPIVTVTISGYQHTFFIGSMIGINSVTFGSVSSSRIKPY